MKKNEVERLAYRHKEVKGPAFIHREFFPILFNFLWQCEKSYKDSVGQRGIAMQRVRARVSENVWSRRRKWKIERGWEHESKQVNKKSRMRVKARRPKRGKERLCVCACECVWHVRVWVKNVILFRHLFSIQWSFFTSADFLIFSPMLTISPLFQLQWISKLKRKKSFEVWKRKNYFFWDPCDVFLQYLWWTWNYHKNEKKDGS